MALAPGSRIGVYEVTALIGAGGMGEVYRARDTRLNRDVALKVLPDALALDADRAARFRREAHVLASLNHPHIAAIYGLEEANGSQCLVLELVEGETLASRLTAGPIPLAETLTIARQVAEACQAAHEKGIVHRDLKPANIASTKDEQVKVLDFGLAKEFEPNTARDISNSPTLSLAATQAGVILGTAAYMSPEQAKGREADKRADVWAVGAVLFEMLTGRRAFEGEDLSDTVAAVLLREPNWSLLPPETPPAIRTLVQRCLAKDRTQRIADISVALFVMNDPASLVPVGPAVAGPPPTARRLPVRTLVATVAAVAATAAVAGATVWFALRPALPQVTRLEIGGAFPNVTADRFLAISPDGSRVAWVSGDQIAVRAMDQLDPTLIPGLGVPRGLFFSPDGQWIGFFDGINTLKKVPVAGGAAVTICRLPGGGPRGATWGPDGTIVLATTDPASGLWRVSEAGGEPSLLTKADRQRGDLDHIWPEFLPGGQTLLFTILSSGPIDVAQVAVLDLRTGDQRVLVRGGSHAHYVASGHLAYATPGTLRAMAFNLARLEVSGTPSVLAQISTNQNGAGQFDIARDGTLIYQPPIRETAASTMVWVDRQGREAAINVPVRAYSFPRLSPDGRRVAVDVADQDRDVWIWDFARETFQRVTRDPALDQVPVWTPDGRRLVFASRRTGAFNLFWQPADATGSPEQLTTSPNDQYPTAVSPDGTIVVFRENAATPDLLSVTLDKEHRVQPLVETAAAEINGEISPDGHWLAYESNDSGRKEIYVRPFPNVSGGLWPVSTEGGLQPVWAANGKELFFRSPAGALMSVGLPPGTTWAATKPRELFRGSYFLGNATAAGLANRTYDVSADGQRFLMVKAVGGTDQAAPLGKLVVVQNWTEDLRRLVPAN